MFGWFWQTLYCALDYPHWGIFPSLRWDFVWAVVWGWMVSVGCLPHDFDIGSYTGAYFPHFLWVSLRLRQWPAWFLDWVLAQSFRRSIVSEPPYMDLLRWRWIASGFTRGAWVDLLARCSWDRFVSAIVTLHIGLSRWVVLSCTLRFAFRWAMIYTLWDLPFEIHRQSNFSDIEGSFSLDFSEVCHDASVSDLLISADDWFTGCFSSVSTLDTRTYFPS